MTTAQRSLFTFGDAIGSARFSPCQRYRYELTRTWGPRKNGIVCFVALNPSTAGANEDDPTIRREVGFAKSWGYEGLVKVNLFAWRETDSSKLAAVEDPVGPENDVAIIAAAKAAALVACCWGTKGTLHDRDRQVWRMLRSVAIVPRAIRLTAGGHPEHPLYLPKMLQPQIFCPGWSL